MNNDINEIVITEYDANFTMNVTDTGIDTFSYSGGSNGLSWQDFASDMDTNGLRVRGEAQFDGNVTIGGVDICATLAEINTRLNILKVDAKLESRWNALAQLGQQYRKLEAECLEAEEMVRILRE